MSLIALPDGGKLVVLLRRGQLHHHLPDDEAASEWQAAIEALMLVADLGGNHQCSPGSA